MTLEELDAYFRRFLKIEDYPADPSRNGIQIQNSNPAGKQIEKIAFAVDACEETAEAAAGAGAGMLFVHHGLFWGGCETLTDSFYRRVAPFLKNDIALYACHIPLDANNPCGNNYGLAARISLSKMEPFGEWRGMSVGVKGILKKPLSAGELAEKILNPGERPLHVLPFGKKEIRSVGIISGGAGDDVSQAVAAGLDAYVTGEVGHELFHYIKESEITVIAGGHYQTETVGVNLVREKIAAEKNIETVFLDVPTGM